jgi:predicted small integral membrane protein
MVSNMEDTFSKMKGWRSVNNEVAQHVLYILIVAWELSIAVLLLLGSFKMINKFKATAPEFINAKKYTSFGLSLGVLLWFTVFIAIGGEWFLMWQSKSWNAQYTGFFLTCCFLLFLIHHNQEDI